MIGRVVRLAGASGLALLISLGLLGQVVRDRGTAWALLMYLPVVPLGLMAVVFDALARGRAWPRGRFVLGGVGLVAALGASWPMVGFGPSFAAGDPSEISVLHWNVVWGGGKGRSPERWAAIRREILDRPADLVVLSEGPPDDWLDPFVRQMGPKAARVQVENASNEGYWYKLVVIASGPLRVVRREPIAQGAGVVVEAEVRGRLVRLLVVDAQSHPAIPRASRLLDVAAACQRARAFGQPIDLVVGDFNSLSRSLGFDAIEAQGYALASRAARGWRGTFPAALPVYDIDHVLIRRELPLTGSQLFTNLASDHRGQVARFRVP